MTCEVHLTFPRDVPTSPTQDRSWRRSPYMTAESLFHFYRFNAGGWPVMACSEGLGLVRGEVPSEGDAGLLCHSCLVVARLEFRQPSDPTRHKASYD